MSTITRATRPKSRSRVLRVTAWETHFENNRTRALGQLRWVPIPNKMDGSGYVRLVSHENGAAHFGVWIACVEIASKCTPRGALLRGDGAPHDYESLALISRIPAPTFAEAIPRLVEIGWLENVPLAEVKQSMAGASSRQGGAGPPQPTAAKPQEPALNGMEGNGREGNNNNMKGRTRNRSEGSDPEGRDGLGVGALVAPALAGSGAPVAVVVDAVVCGGGSADASDSQTWTRLSTGTFASKGQRRRLTAEEVESRRQRQKAALAASEPVLKGFSDGKTQ